MIITTGAPVFVARLQVLNALGLFDSLNPDPFGEQPRIKFTVKKSLESDPNTATIDLYNLNDLTIDLIRGVVRTRIEWSAEEKAALMLAGASSAPVELTSDGFGLGSVVLSWGYADSATMLLPPALKIGFKGQSTDIKIVPSGTDRILRIEAEDCGHLLGAAEVVQLAGGGVVPLVNKSYAPGTPVAVVIKDFINAMGISVSLPDLTLAIANAFILKGLPTADTMLMSGYNASGSARDQLERFLKALGIRWSIQDGEFIVLTGAGVLLGYDPLVLSTALGNIIGQPEQRESTKLAIQTFADADARPGRMTTVASTTISAAYRIAHATTNGDTKSGGQTALDLDELVTIAGVF